MALAWATKRQEGDGSTVSALLLSGVGAELADASAALLAAGSPAAPGGPGEGALPPGYVLLLTQVLPDGMGDLIFGENAVHELEETAPVVWLRCYVEDKSSAPGELLVGSTASKLPLSIACTKSRALETVGESRLEELWAGARERFLAPWIFGLSAHEEALLRLATKTGKAFWALTEYGRGMGNIHSYTAGLGSMIPTGWTLGDEPGGVFRSIQRLPRTETDWRRKFAEYCGLEEGCAVRLWWFYSRKDDEEKHEFLAREGVPRDQGWPPHVWDVSKVIPVNPDGSITIGSEKTSGEKLAEQMFQAAADPSFKATTNVTSKEVAAGCAGQLSQFLWGLLFDPHYVRGAPPEGAVDIVVAPNVLTREREAAGGTCAAARVTHLDLVQRSGASETVPLPERRRVLVCSARVPRGEMRTFLGQCEDLAFTTGDQSLAEALFMGMIPCVKPDAKVSQWQLALTAKAAGALDRVPDLGDILRRLVTDEEAKESARRASRERSDRLEGSMVAQLGGPPNAWSATQQVLARAGMLG